MTFGTSLLRSRAFRVAAAPLLAAAVASSAARPARAKARPPRQGATAVAVPAPATAVKRSAVQLDMRDGAVVYGQNVYKVHPNKGQNGNANLFFNFSRLDVVRGDEVSFAPAAPTGTARRIFALVHANGPSAIDGKLRTPRGADFILVNSAGLRFGPAASIATSGGSFTATSAGGIRFTDGMVLDTTAYGRAAPAATPAALLMQGGRPDAGVVLLDAASLRVSRRDETLSEPIPNVTLAGSSVTLRHGSRAEARGGRITLAALTIGDLTLGGETRGSMPPSVGTAAERGDVALYKGSVVETSDFDALGVPRAGDIFVFGRNVSVVGTIARGAGSVRSSLSANSVAGATGPAGDVFVDATGLLRVQHGGTIIASSVVDRDPAPPAGHIRVHAGEVLLDGGLRDARETGLLAFSLNGAPGSVTLETSGSLLLRDGAVIRASGDRHAAGGAIALRAAAAIEINGLNAAKTGVFAHGTLSGGPDANGTGDGGVIDIRSDAFTFSNGARLSASAEDGGRGGAVSVSARRDLLGLSGGDGTAMEADGGGMVTLAYGRLLRLVDVTVSADAPTGIGAGGAAGRITIFDGRGIGVADLAGATLSAPGAAADAAGISVASDVIVLRNGTLLDGRASVPISLAGQLLFIAPDTTLETSSLTLRGDSAAAQDMLSRLLPGSVERSASGGAAADPPVTSNRRRVRVPKGMRER